MSFVGFCALAGFGLWAPWLPPIVRRLLRASSVYFLITFVLRPAFLVVDNPVPSLTNTLADQTLLTPTYMAGIQHIAPMIIADQACVILAVYLFSMLVRRGLQFSDKLVVEPFPLILVYASCWACRLLSLTHLVGGGGPGVIVTRLAPMGTALMAYVVVTTAWRADDRMRVFVRWLIVGEVLWALLDASKTPLIALFLAFYLEPGRLRWSLRQVALSIVGVFLAFGVIQRLKPGSEGSVSLDPTAVFGDLLVRFDLLHATAIARNDGPGSYMSAGAALRTMLADLLPQQLSGTTRLSDGQEWAVVMEQAASGVALATGSVAEGFAIAGYAGIIASAIFVSFCTVLGARLIVSRSPSWIVLWVLYVVTSGAFFEQGPIGLVQTVSSGLQASLIVAVLLLVLGSPARGWVAIDAVHEKAALLRSVPTRGLAGRGTAREAGL